MLKFCHYRTPLGLLIAVGEVERLHSVDFFTDHSLEGYQEERGGVFALLEEALSSYFSRKDFHYNISLLVQGSDFEKKVWRALAEIPLGEVRSYKEIAERIGNPKACRAVGQAVGRNPFSILIPCHRVVQSNGNLGGYAWGVERKRWLLNHEARAPLN